MKYKLSEEELDQMIRDAAVDAYGDEEIFMSILHTLEIMLEAADRSFRGYPRHLSSSREDSRILMLLLLSIICL